jgi:hypothetical protein
MGRRLVPGLLLALWITPVDAATSSASKELRVFVSAGGPGGEVTEDLFRSAADLVKALRRSAGLQLVPASGDADVQLVVTERFLRRTGRIVPVPTGAASVVFVPIRNRVVTVSLVARGSTLQLTGEHRSSWGRAARNVAEQVEEWIRANEP